jgi:hypothetical protein
MHQETERASLRKVASAVDGTAAGFDLLSRGIASGTMQSQWYCGRAKARCQTLLLFRVG